MKQGTSEWLEWRKTKIGASDAPIIMGMSPWMTPLQLWEQKLGMSEHQSDNAATYRGKQLEPQARKAFEDFIGDEVFPQVVTHAELDWMIASLDGLSLDRKIAVEIKCPGKDAHAQAVAGKVPDHYYPQLQHQLAVLNMPFMYYWSYDGSEGVCIRVERDETYLSGLISAETEFYKRMQSGTPPELSFKDKLEFDDWQGYYTELMELQDAEKLLNEQLSEIKHKRELIKQRLITESGGHSAVGCGIMLTKSYRKGLVDYGKIPELKGVNLEKYRKAPSESWRLTLGG